MPTTRTTRPRATAHWRGCEPRAKTSDRKTRVTDGRAHLRRDRGVYGCRVGGRVRRDPRPATAHAPLDRRPADGVAAGQPVVVRDRPLPARRAALLPCAGV